MGTRNRMFPEAFMREAIDQETSRDLSAGW